MHLLAQALGIISAQSGGLSRIVLPKGLPSNFRKEIFETVKSEGSDAIVVGNGEDELSPEQAISYRTPSDDEISGVVLVTTEDLPKNLKSLETFRDALSHGLPGGILEGESAFLELELICKKVVSLATNQAKINISDEGLVHLEALVHGVAKYLAKAYQCVGNDAIAWTSAYWRHLDFMSEELPTTLDYVTLGKSEKLTLAHAAYLAAGLPRPESSEGFKQKNSADKFSKIIQSQWSDNETLERELHHIQVIDGVDGKPHPIYSIEWDTLSGSKIILGHPILAIAWHGHSLSKSKWLDAWSNVSETAFFHEMSENEKSISTTIIDESSGRVIPTLNLKKHPTVFVFPQPPDEPRPGEVLEISSFRIKSEFSHSSTSGNFDCELEVTPKSAADVEVSSSEITTTGLEIRATLARRLTRQSSWREKPIVLTIVPSHHSAEILGIDRIKIHALLPHPSRPTVFAIESKNLRSKPKLQFHANTKLFPASPGVEEVPEIKLDGSRSQITVVCAGKHEEVSWVGGDSIDASGEKDDLTGLAYYPVQSMPDDPEIGADGFVVRLAVPESEKGHISPIMAAITNEPLVPASGDLWVEIMSDPRFKIEQWLSDSCLRGPTSENFKNCLGSTLLTINPERTINDLKWDSRIGAYSDFDPTITVNAQFPTPINHSSVFTDFWEQFEALNLRDLIGQTKASALPSALDLRTIPKRAVNRYLRAFNALLGEINPNVRGSAWIAFPFSAILFDSSVGEFKGMLLSPLHPLRMAWNWSAQKSSSKLAAGSPYQAIAPSFLRFLDGDSLPLVGPSLSDSVNNLAMGLAAGPDEFFACWSMLGSIDLHSQHIERNLQLLGLRLPLGAPSGLDRGGVFSAIKDYMRVFPFTPQLRIGLSSKQGYQRYTETDDAMIAASTELLSRSSQNLPGGVRILDSKDRGGKPPNASHILRRLHANNKKPEPESLCPAFEWLRDNGNRAVDIRLVEDSPVKISLDSRQIQENPGTTGPSLPINRFKSWMGGLERPPCSKANTTVSSSAFSSIKSFQKALERFETLSANGNGTVIKGTLQLGDNFMDMNARWTITGTSHLDPSSLSAQLESSGGNLILWEWRPAFLTRTQQQGARTPVASNQPYTILARATDSLTQSVQDLMEASGVDPSMLNPNRLFHVLGTRGIGLASLLTMGHSQSMGALGFFMAFKALENWEVSAPEGEIRCVIPMDAIYPLINVLAINAEDVDDQKRADLLLLKMRITDDGKASALLHPIEIKARSRGGERFPQPNDSNFKDPLRQLKATQTVVDALSSSLKAVQDKYVLINSAVATLMETALTLRPLTSPKKPNVEIQVLQAAALGLLEVESTPGTLLWFQAHARGTGEASYESRSGNTIHSGCFLSDFIAAANASNSGEYSRDVSHVIESSMPDWSGKSRVTAEHVKGHEASSDKTESEAESSKKDTSNIPSPVIQVTPKENPKLGNDTQLGAQPKPEQSQNDGVRILVGEQCLETGSQPVMFRPSETSLNQLNIGVIGDLGTGKTQFLKSLVFQLTRAGPENRGRSPKVFIFDYKQDYSSGKFPDKTNAQILDPTHTLPLNFFALGESSTHVDRVQRAHFFADMLRRIARIGIVQQQNLYESIMEAYNRCSSGVSPILNDIYEIYRDKVSGKADSVISELALVTDLRIFEQDTKKICSFNDLYTQNTVLNLANLGKAGQNIVDIVATMFLDHLYHDYMKNIQKAPFLKGDDGISRRLIDSFILIDEAHHAMGRGFDVLMKLMLEGREFGMGVILSSQFLSHFQSGGHDWAEALSTWVVHNVRNAKAKDFEKIGFRKDTQAMATQVPKLEPHWAYYRCANGQTEGLLMQGQPFFSLPEQNN